MSDEESDFYGDEDLVGELERRVDTFNVKEWWETHKTPTIPVRRQASDVQEEASRYHNPYAGEIYARQLTESVEAFLSRLPPSTTEEIPGHPWIWIHNPYIKRQSKHKAANQRVRGGEDEMPEDEGADLPALLSAGEARLHLATDRIVKCRKPGVSQTIITEESKKAGADAVKDILDLAKAHRVTCGKWMLFCRAHEVDDVWEIIAKATAKNELGIGAKVAAKSDGYRKIEQLICVYTADFSDIKDVTRVARKLKQFGLATQPLYYKPVDAYTYLGIGSGNPWGVRASIYDTRSLLGK
ncbi:DUF1917-domain-containing protein [Xylaria nigripes]|nr:DUF1917-domain-containing protein [Xylaria nigripes]